jgi:hypothetical protein
VEVKMVKKAEKIDCDNGKATIDYGRISRARS